MLKLVKMEKLLEEIAEILEEDAVELNDELESFDSWDSLTILSIIALASENYNVTLSNDEITNSKTVQGLLDLIKSRMQ